jgi:hypothetical protein
MVGLQVYASRCERTTFGEEELVDLVLSVASGRLNKQGLIAIFESRCKPIEEP